MAPGFELLFQNLESIGFFEFFLPIILFVAIYYGLLTKLEVLGEDEAVNGTASIALAFATTFGIYAVVPASFFPQFFGLLATVLIAILAVALTASMAGMNITDEDQKWLRLAVFGGGVLLIVLALPSLTGSLLNFELGQVSLSLDETMMSFLLTLAFIGMIGYVMRTLIES